MRPNTFSQIVDLTRRATNRISRIHCPHGKDAVIDGIGFVKEEINKFSPPPAEGEVIFTLVFEDRHEESPCESQGLSHWGGGDLLSR